MDEDQEDEISYPVRRVNDQVWLRIISNSSYALHNQSTSYRTCLVIQLSFTFPQVVSPCLKVSIAGIMHLEINDAVNFYTSSIPKDTSCSFQADWLFWKLSKYKDRPKHLSPVNPSLSRKWPCSSPRRPSKVSRPTASSPSRIMMPILLHGAGTDFLHEADPNWTVVESVDCEEGL